MKVFAYAAFAAALACAGAAEAASIPNASVGYSLGNNGATLVRFGDLSNPFMASGTAITDGAGGAVTLHGLAYRPRTGQLYGYSDTDDAVYLVDPNTGVATFQAGLANATSVTTLGADFNNFVDALRVVSTADENIVFFPNNTPPNVAAFTDPFYAPGDVNAGVDPSIFGNAYTNAVPFPTSTLQFGLDSATDSLVTIANNAGTLTTIGELFLDGMAFDVTADGGFDILSFQDGDNTAIALLTSFSAAFSGQGLFEVPLVADAMGRINLSLIGAVTNAFGPLNSFAVQPVPLPAPAFLLLGGLAALGFVGRRRRA